MVRSDHHEMPAIYNEIEPYPAEWMRNLIEAGHINSGVVTERSIVDLVPEDVQHATQAHFFAGIGVWSHALRLAGWPDDAEAWTGSCPCQPFSTAGKRGGIEDKRHLWPDWFRLIRECRPPVVFGEQVASPDGLGWFDAVRTDLEDAGYAVAGFDLCAAGVGAPHIRQRLYFMAYANGERLKRVRLQLRERESRSHLLEATRSSETRIMANTDNARSQGRILCGDRTDEWSSGESSLVKRMGNADEFRGARNTGSSGRTEKGDAGTRNRAGRERNEPVIAGPVNGFWRNADWIYCRDEKYRAVEPGTQPLAHGDPSRVGRLRAYGNAIVLPLAQTFIESAIDVLCSRITGIL